VPDTIEAEVLEIDGSPPPPPPEPEPSRRDDPWRAMRGRVLRLDRRWWPLWLVLGILAVGLLLTLGVVAAVVILIAKVIRGVFRLFTGGAPRPSGASSLSRRA
jgi:hypothetical protein